MLDPPTAIVWPRTEPYPPHDVGGLQRDWLTGRILYDALVKAMENYQRERDECNVMVTTGDRA